MKHYHKNPRQISQKQFGDLRRWLRDLGDLSGIVHDLNSDEIVAGNQRSRVFDINNCEIVIATQWDKPDEQGTVALGYVLWDDKQYSYRAVRWTERQCEQANIVANRGGGEWDLDELANWDVRDLIDWGFDEEELLGTFDLNDDMSEGSAKTIGRGGRLYVGHDIEPYKLAHRIEAIWQAGSGLALDLFSGQGELAEWYRRRFERVVTVDKSLDCDVDYQMKTMQFIQKHLYIFIDFDFVDFDDEGSPAREIKLFFDVLKGNKEKSFVLALTDGNGLNLKMRGKHNPALYLLPGEMHQATQNDYEQFESMVTEFMKMVARDAGFDPTALSSYRGRQGNVVYQTWLIEPCAIARTES